MLLSSPRAAALVLAVLLACSSSRTPAEPPPQRPQVVETPEASRERLLAKLVADVLETQHLLGRHLDDSISQKAFDGYLDRLDPGKMFLMSEDVKALQAHQSLMDDELRDGTMALAHAGAAVYAKRLQQVSKLVSEILAQPMDFEVDETFQTDPEKRAFCDGENALRDRWRRSLKREALQRIQRMEEMRKAFAKIENPEDKKKAAASVAKIPKKFVGQEKRAREDLAKSYAARFARLATPEPLDAASMFLNAVSSVYDPHTAYLPPVDKENFDINMSGSLEGIGAVLSESDHYIQVISVVPGGASWRQGELEAGDMILSVAQDSDEPVDVGDMRINTVVQMIRGPKGTVVVLTVQKPDDQIKVISITRDVVKIESAYARGAVLSRPGAGRVGYINLPSFYGNTRSSPGDTPERSCTQDVRRLLELFAADKVDRVIIDLRGNGGGLLDDAQQMSGLFIERGPIVQTSAGKSSPSVLRDPDPSISFRGQVVVMVDRFSASASEILAAALQDYGRAVVVGTSATHGKGTVQVMLNLDRFKKNTSVLPSLGVLKLTIQQFFRVTGGSTQWRGVEPDVLLPDPSAHVKSGERYLDNSIPWSEVPAVPFSKWTDARWDKQALVTRSAERQAGQSDFAKYNQRANLLRERQADSEVPLARKKWLAEREADRKAFDALTPDLDKAAGRFVAKVVDYDGTAAVPKAKRPGHAAEPDQNDLWRENLQKDIWIEEAMFVLQDMATLN